MAYTVAIITHKAKHTGYPSYLAYKAYALFCQCNATNLVSVHEVLCLNASVPIVLKRWVLQRLLEHAATTLSHPRQERQGLSSLNFVVTFGDDD